MGTIREQKQKRKAAGGPIDPKEIENMLPEEFDTLFETTPLTTETTCGYWLFKGCMQKFANKKMYVLLYGVTGCLLGATYAYFNATITTIEKRYRIPSRNTGIISTGNDISSVFVSAILSYYGGKSNRPRWMSMGLLALVVFCFMNTMPHWLYGAGEDALLLTVEHEADYRGSNSTEFLANEKRKLLCLDKDSTGAHCDMGEGNWWPQIILFVAQLISGVGQTLYYTLGTSYMDDNIQKSKSATYLSISYFMRLLGPAFGYTMASFFLKLFIEPSLTPTITTQDPRWVGAWWLGWIVLGIPMLMAVPFMAMFPKSLPRAAVRKIIQKERLRRELSVAEESPRTVEKASIKDMMVTFKRLLRNRTYMLKTVSDAFYVFGYIPYWTYTPKYLETQYHQSASTASLVTGTVAFAFSALGILLAGVVISRCKPNARHMVSWNLLVGLLTVAGMLTYSLLGCPVNGTSMISTPTSLDATTCNSNCSCDYVKYSPVCGEDGRTHISACHAGCRDEVLINDKKIFTQCSCVAPNRTSALYNVYTVPNNTSSQSTAGAYQQSFNSAPLESLSIATAGPCPVDCYKYFVSFLAVMCVLKFVGATGRATSFLVSVRCVDENDKSVSLGFSLMIMSIFTLVPSPIFFGWLMDRNCLVWGKTCSGKGNCWLYNIATLRYSLNTIAASCVFVSVLFDLGVWYYAKDLKMYDDEQVDEKSGKAVELADLAASTDADVMMTYKSGHRGSDVCT